MEYIIGLVILAGIAYWAVKRNAKVQPTSAEAPAPYKVEVQAAPAVVEVSQPVVEAAPVAKAEPAVKAAPAKTKKPVAKKPAAIKAAPKSATKAKTTDAKPKKPRNLKVAK